MALRIAKIHLRLFGIFPLPKHYLPLPLREYQMVLNYFAHFTDDALLECVICVGLSAFFDVQSKNIDNIFSNHIFHHSGIIACRIVSVDTCPTNQTIRHHGRFGRDD